MSNRKWDDISWMDHGRCKINRCAKCAHAARI